MSNITQITSAQITSCHPAYSKKPQDQVPAPVSYCIKRLHPNGIVVNTLLGKDGVLGEKISSLSQGYGSLPQRLLPVTCPSLSKDTTTTNSEPKTAPVISSARKQLRKERIERLKALRAESSLQKEQFSRLAESVALPCSTISTTTQSTSTTTLSTLSTSQSSSTVSTSQSSSLSIPEPRIGLNRLSKRTPTLTIDFAKYRTSK